MSMFEKTEKIFPGRFEKENYKPLESPFYKAFRPVSGFVKKIEIFQKKACNYKKGMVLFNSSLRETQNSET